MNDGNLYSNDNPPSAAPAPDNPAGEKMTFASGGSAGFEPSARQPYAPGPYASQPYPQQPYPYPPPYAPNSDASAYYGSYGAPGAASRSAPEETPVSLGEWLWSLLLLCVPFVGFIAVFVFAFGDSKPSKKNFFRALLIVALIALVLAIVISVAAALVYMSVDPAELTSEMGKV